MNPKITAEEAAAIFKDRFSPGTTKRSIAYKEGYQARLQRVSTGIKNVTEETYQAGTAEFDAFWSGFDHALNSIDVYIGYRDDPGDEPTLNHQDSL